MSESPSSHESTAPHDNDVTEGPEETRKYVFYGTIVFDADTEM